ncbi:ABC transporter permease [Clostridium formicaceticum]|uniref:ABC transporter permease n=1 Tax=Clostridium formicaceticum TaxID=1497 RepID=A0AAC9RMC6_9CLOT|nr:ABC transporter permease subunit [Clostridium formicaceticum]AOY75281.1 ABC transporter permease [Clostridium formicaceticum]ARE89719.1 Bicarbonate transport system permease protein CmpB [Clostridium formicaceticum]
MKDFITKSKKKALDNAFAFLFWLTLWQITYFVLQRDIYLPSPLSVFTQLKELVFLRIFWESIAYSIYRVILGVFLSTILGITMGIVCSAYRFVYNLVNPLMVAIKSTPILSFIIIALVWFSSSHVPIFTCFLMCFPIIWTNIMTGLANVDPKLLQMAKLYRIKKRMIVKKIYLPTIIPYFSTACITSLGLGWKVSVAAEVLSHPKNAIGSQLYSAKIYLDASGLFAWTLVIILLSLLFERIFTCCLEKITTKKALAIKGDLIHK